jgi:hypothetical protein
MAEPVTKGNIVEEYKIGNTTIKISDEAYRDKKPEELEEILIRIQSRAWDCILSARAAGKDV